LKNLFSIFIAYGFVWILNIGYLLSIAVRQNGLKREIATLKAVIEQGNQGGKAGR
jgi:CcmD family protein